MRWLKNSVIALFLVGGWLTLSPQPARGQILAVWGWRNLVAPQVGGPWIAPDIRFRPLGLLDDPYWGSPAVAYGHGVFVVNVPEEDARVWVQGQQMPGTGKQRVFTTPPLQAGFDYPYEIRARWVRDNQTVEGTRTVPIRLGQQVIVDFSRPEAKLRMPYADGR